MTKPEDIILLARLLRQREAAFITVRDCEDRIRQRLGGAAFPFPPPPALPSTRRPGRPAAAPARGMVASLRRLRPAEDAYRIRCLWRGASCESLSGEVEAVRALAAVPPDLLTLQEVEAVRLDETGAVCAAERLWPATPEPPGDAPPGRL